MDTLKNKAYATYNYTSRYTGVPYYYDTIKDREVYGIGSNMIQLTESYSHIVKDGDTLDSLALKYYNNPTYWWIIAYYNDIQDAFVPLIDQLKNREQKVIQIPSISSIEFGREN